MGGFHENKHDARLIIVQGVLLLISEDWVHPNVKQLELLTSFQHSLLCVFGVTDIEMHSQKTLVCASLQ